MATGVAQRTGRRYVEIEVVCSDRAEHRRRVVRLGIGQPTSPGTSCLRGSRFASGSMNPGMALEAPWWTRRGGRSRPAFRHCAENWTAFRDRSALVAHLSTSTNGDPGKRPVRSLDYIQSNQQTRRKFSMRSGCHTEPRSILKTKTRAFYHSCPKIRQLTDFGHKIKGPKFKPCLSPKGTKGRSSPAVAAVG